MRIAALLLLLAGCGGDVLKPNCIKDFKGLFGSSNSAGVPEGACETADNCVLRVRGVPEPRRGYTATSPLDGPINAIGFKDGRAITLTYDTPSAAGAVYAYNPATGGWNLLPMNPGGRLLPDRPGISGAHTHFVSTNKALYFQSRYGLAKIESVAGGVSMAALHPPPQQSTVAMNTGAANGGQYPVSNGGSVNWLADGQQVAYRHTICRLGANKELIESAPSQRIIASNTSGSPGFVKPTLINGYDMHPDAFFRIYRSKAVPNGTDPSDEMFLVAEVIPANTTTLDADGFLQAGQATTYFDNTQDSFLVVPLYTNPYSGNGIASANASPPLSADMAWFRDRMHYLNTQDVQRVALRVIGTGTGGIDDGAWINIGGFQFVFHTVPGGLSTEIKVFTAGTVSQNVDNTGRSITQRVTADLISAQLSPAGDSTILATYTSLTANDAGQILLQAQAPGTAAFTVKTSGSVGWDRDYSGGVTSDPNAQIAGWMWSNEGEPEGVPTANNNPIGDLTADGQRLIALKDTLFAFKKDGLWKITDDGSTVGPSVQLVDPTIHLAAPESAVALDNMLLALCDQGVVLITETGAVLNISHTQIGDELAKLMAYVGSATLAEKAFAVALQPTHEYVLALPESPNATSASVEYVYNLQTQAWQRWKIAGVLSGAVNPDTGELYWGREDGTLWIERKDHACTDFQDPGFTIAAPTQTQTASLVFTGDLRTGATPFAVGDIVQQFQAVKALQQQVTAVAYNSTTNQTTVTLDAVPRYAWDTTALTVLKAIQVNLKFLPFNATEPLTEKSWENCYLSFRYCDMNFFSVGWESEKYRISSDVNPAQERVTNSDGSSDPIAPPITLETWGAAAWGARIWGRQTRDVVIKTTLPQDFSKAAQLTLALNLPCCLSSFKLNAIDVKISGASDRVVR